jgi:hypothetical protein
MGRGGVRDSSCAATREEILPMEPVIKIVILAKGKDVFAVKWDAVMG